MLTANIIPAGNSSSDRYFQFDNDTSLVHDLGALVMDGKAGEIHVGLSERFIQQKIEDLRMTLEDITAIFCFLGAVAAFSFAEIINRPLRSLSIAAEHFGQGKAVSRLEIRGHDEIGLLTSTFNQMVEKVESSRESQKQVEAALRLSRNEWERTFNALTDIVTLQTPDMRIVKTNASGCRTLGIAGEDIAGHHCYELFHGSAEPCPDCPLLQTKQIFSPYTKEMYHDKLGKTFLVSASPIMDANGMLSHIVHVATDITAIKESEENLQRLAAAIDQASETVVITDLQGDIQYVNPAFEKLTGYSSEEVVGGNPRILNSGQQSPEFYKKMWNLLLSGESWSGHLVNRKKDGALFEEEATISPVRNGEGKITNFVAVKRDVSKEVLLEKQLRQAMKMEAIGTLAGGIAHDFNNILTAILGYSEIAKEQLSTHDPIRKDLDQVIVAGHRATALVKQILAFSRQEELDLRPRHVHPVVQEALKLLRSTLPSTIRLEENIDINCGPVLADPTEIHQVIMNLCTNAKHAIIDGTGVLSVSLTERKVSYAEPVVDCPELLPGTYLDIEISDTGYGMDGVTRAKIFDPFFTTKATGEGTGLGLAVVHGIIKRHKGLITVVSEPGEGTVFHIYLPVIKKEEQKNPPAIDDIQGGCERIVLVDDEPVICDMMERMLTNFGYTVTVFTSSADALSAYRKNPEDFDLVVTDMTMPGMTGAELTRELLAVRSDLPVVLCTGFSEAIDEARAKFLGIREYIMKPVDKQALAKAIRKALKVS